MSDTEKMEAPPALSSSSQPLWPRIAAQFTAHRVTAGFTVILALATLALVFTAYFQHRDAVEAIQATQRLALATENSVTDRRQTSSATLVLKLDDTLEASRYQKIITEIESHGGNYPILIRTQGRSGKFTDSDIEAYISVFEDLGYFIHGGLITTKMAYDHFSYDVEKAWCNTDVQQIVRESQKDDKSITATADPMYGNFEKLAKEYLAEERQTCKDLNNQ